MIIIIRLIIKFLLVAVAICFGVKIGYERSIKDVLTVVEKNKGFATDMNNDFDEGYYTACNHIEVAAKALGG